MTEVEITKEGESIVLTPKRKSWMSLLETEAVDADFLVYRPDILEVGRVEI